MTSTGDILENMPIDKWLAELHMECYKKNLEKYNTIKVSELVYVTRQRWVEFGFFETQFNTSTATCCGKEGDDSIQLAFALVGLLNFCQRSVC